MTISYPAIVVAKEASTGKVHPGGVVSYTITVHNRAPVEVRDVTVSDELSGVLGKATYLHDARVSPTGAPRPDVNTTTGKLTWHGRVNPDERVTIIYSVRVHDDARGYLVDGVTGPDGSTCPGPKPAEPCLTVTPIVPPAAAGPDLALTKTASSHTVHPGEQVTFELVVHNHGPGEATGVMVEDPVPPGLVFQEAHPSQGHCTITRRELRCALGTIHAGGEALTQLTARVAADASGPIVNRAIEWSIDGDPNPSNDTATSTVQVTPPPGPGAQPVSDLRIQLHGPHGHVLAGQRHTFMIVVTNRGPDPAHEIVVTFTASLPLRIISAHAVRDSCTTTLPVRCELGTLPVGGRVRVKIVAVPRVSRMLRTAAGVVSASRDPTPRSSVATAATTILAPAAPSPPPFTG